MSFFYSNLSGMGPGGEPELAPKRGLARFWEILTRDTWGLLAAGALAMVSCLVYAIGLMVSVDSHALLIALIACPLGGIIATPQLCGMTDTILRALRDEAGFWWMSYRRAWVRNVKSTLIPGAIGGLLFGFQYFILAHADVMGIDLFILITMLFGVMLATAIATWLLPQLALMELPLPNALLNAILLCMRHPLRTLAALLVQLAYWTFLAFSFPYSLIPFVLLNFWFPMLITLMILYEALDETFHIEESIEETRNAK